MKNEKIEKKSKQTNVNEKANGNKQRKIKTNKGK